MHVKNQMQLQMDAEEQKKMESCSRWSARRWREGPWRERGRWDSERGRKESGRQSVSFSPSHLSSHNFKSSPAAPVSAISTGGNAPGTCYIGSLNCLLPVISSERSSLIVNCKLG